MLKDYLDDIRTARAWAEGQRFASEHPFSEFAGDRDSVRLMDNCPVDLSMFADVFKYGCQDIWRKDKEQVITLSDIHISPGEATIQGEENHTFMNMKVLLEHLGCTVQSHRVETHEAAGCKTAQAKFNVEFPKGSKVLYRPKSPNTTAAGKSRGPQRRSSRGKGQVLVPGESSDFVITYYAKWGPSTEMFDRGVWEVEKEA